MAKISVVKQLSELAIAKLESSGITAAQAIELGFTSCANANTLHGSFEALPALILPYGRSDRPNHPDFYRVRYLGDMPVSFGNLNKKPQRYTQPPGTGVCAYLASVVDWDAIREDVTEPLVITEGELKAAKACLEQ